MIIYNNISKLKNDNYIYLGNNDFQKCRFCGKSKAETTFINISHAIPESVGNKRLVNKDECDLCNKHFAKFETELSKFLSIERVLAKIETKDEIFKFLLSNKGGKTHEIINDSINKIQGINLEDNINVELNEWNGDVTIHYRKQGFDSLKVYKALVKMALSVIPVENINSYSILRNFILQHDSKPELLIKFYDGISVINTFHHRDCLEIKKIKFSNINYKEGLSIGLKKINDNIGFVFYLYVGSTSYQVLILTDSILQNMAGVEFFNGDIKVNFKKTIDKYYLNPNEINKNAVGVIVEFIICNKKYKKTRCKECISSFIIPIKLYTNFGGRKYPFVNWYKLNFMIYFDNSINIEAKCKLILFSIYYEDTRRKYMYFSDAYIVFLFEKNILRNNY